MKATCLLPAFLMFAIPRLHAQSKVASFSASCSEYEEFSFWVKSGKRADIDYSYSYGKNHKTLSLAYAGTCSIDKDQGFKVKFPNGLNLCVVTKGEHLLVSDSVSHYLKVFDWYYEGPVNGIGTFCEPCAEDEKEAVQLVRTYFLH